MTFDWTAPDGELFPCEEWKAESGPRGVLVCVHGLSGAATDFSALAGAAAQEGFASLAMNLRGQGLDPRAARRGAFLDLPVLANDVAAFTRLAQTRFPGLPLFLCGESMGALIVSWTIVHGKLDVPIRGLLFSAPVVELKKPSPWHLRLALRVLAVAAPNVRFYPAWFVSGKTGPLRVTRDEEHSRRVRSSPYFLRAYTVRFLQAFGELMDESRALAAHVRVPSLVLAAGQDVFIRPGQVRGWFDSLAAEEKTFRLYPEAYHLLWNDFDREIVLRDIQEWLGPRAAGVSI